MFISPNQIVEKPQRIISLVPSLTEFLFHLGLEEEVVGITKFCVHPTEWHRTKTRVGGTKQIHHEIIKGLKPGLIIANKEENTKEDIEKLALEYNVLLTDINNFDEALSGLNTIGAATYKKERAGEIIAGVSQKFSELQIPENPKTAVYLIWKDPYMSVGGDTFISSMLQKAGFENALQSQNRYPQITIEEINKISPDVVFLSSEPYPFTQKHLAEIQPQLLHSKVLLADGEMFSWYGSRMLMAADYFERLKDKSGYF